MDGPQTELDFVKAQRNSAFDVVAKQNARLVEMGAALMQEQQSRLQLQARVAQLEAQIVAAAPKVKKARFKQTPNPVV